MLLPQPSVGRRAAADTQERVCDKGLAVAVSLWIAPLGVVGFAAGAGYVVPAKAATQERLWDKGLCYTSFPVAIANVDATAKCGQVLGRSLRARAFARQRPCCDSALVEFADVAADA